MEPVVSNEPRTWLAVVWPALQCYRNDSIPPEGPDSEAYDAEWDEICTAMAWIAESLGIDPTEDLET